MDERWFWEDGAGGENGEESSVEEREGVWKYCRSDTRRGGFGRRGWEGASIVFL